MNLLTFFKYMMFHIVCRVTILTIFYKYKGIENTKIYFKVIKINSKVVLILYKALYLLFRLF